MSNKSAREIADDLVHASTAASNRLMASAPVLMAALQEIAKTADPNIEFRSPEVRLARICAVTRAAIAKAEGR